MSITIGCPAKIAAVNVFALTNEKEHARTFFDVATRYLARIRAIVL
jgi:hypothetical protein